MDHSYTLISAIGCIITTILNLSFNGAIVATWMKLRRRMREETSSILLLNQAISNIAITIPSMIWVYISLIGKSFNLNLLQLLMVSFYYASFALTFALTTTTVEKLLSVKYPFLHYRIPKKLKLLVPLFCTWGIPIVPAGFAYTYGFQYSSHDAFYNFVMTAFSIMTFLIVFSCGVLLLTLKTLRSMNEQQMIALSSAALEERNETEIEKKRKRDRKLVIGMFCIVPVYAFTILPDLIINMLCFNSTGLNIDHTVCFWTCITYIMYSLYPAANALINICFREDLKWIKRKLQGKNWCSKEVRDTDEITEISNNEDQNVYI